MDAGGLEPELIKATDSASFLRTITAGPLMVVVRHIKDGWKSGRDCVNVGKLCLRSGHKYKKRKMLRERGIGY